MDDILEKKLHPNIHAFNDMLLACSKNGSVQKAFKIYNRLKKHGVEPNLETFNYLINACAEGKGEGQYLERAMWLKQNEMPKFKLQPRRSTYNVLFKCLAIHAKQLDMIDELIAEMNERNLKPDLASYTTLMAALGNRGDLDGARRLWKDMKAKKIAPDLRFYNNLMNIYQLNDPSGEAAYSLFEEMKKDGFAPDARTLSIVLKTAFARKDFGMAEKALASMREWKVEPDTELCNALLHVGARVENASALISQVLAMIRKHRLYTNPDTHNTLIAAYGRLGDYKNALWAFEDMKQKGFRPSSKSYTSLLVACKNAQQPDKAMEIYQLMKQAGIEMDDVFMRLLRDVLRTAGRSDLLAEIRLPAKSAAPRDPAPRRAAPRSRMATADKLS